MPTTMAPPTSPGFPYPWTTADELDAWGDRGFKSCADWFSWRVGVTPSTAREHVRVARALGALPELTLVQDSRDGSWVIRGRLDPEAGAALRRALEAAEDELFGEDGPPEEETTDAHRPRAARRADALGRVAEAALGEGLGGEARTADRYQVVVHVTAETLEGRDGDTDVSAETVPRVEGGPAVSAETARRLACDAGVRGMIHGSGGEILDVGRKTRTVPPATRRALAFRDGGCCRFPGCTTRFCDAHHITPWAEGGETSLDNLVLLCRRHHRRVHEDGWTIEREEGGELRFVRPDGWELPRVPERPAAPEAAVTELKLEQQGLGIDAWTAVNDWLGESMDVDLALDWLRRREPGWDGNGHRNGGSGDREDHVSAETMADDTSPTQKNPGGP